MNSAEASPELDPESPEPPKAEDEPSSGVSETETATGSYDEDVPTNVSSVEQLKSLPEEYLSDDPTHPLLSSDEFGNQYNHVLRPMFYSVVFILLIEVLERFSYYGVANTQILYLTGEYNPDWNAGMTSVQASSFVSTSTGITFTAPFIGGFVADVICGDYWDIVGGVSLFYIPGLLLLALTAYPGLLGDEFNMGALTASLLVLYPLGAGVIKSIVNVLGAKQYHPVLHASFIEQYYVNFYLCINIGALLGGFIIPPIARNNVFAAYMIPTCALTAGLFIFLLGTKRYVLVKPDGKAMIDSFKVMFGSLLCWTSKETQGDGDDDTKREIKPSMPGLEKLKMSNGGEFEDSFVENVRRLLYVCPVSALCLPFNIAYALSATVFVLQGEVMRRAGPFDAAMMENFDPIAVLIVGAIVSNLLYPGLVKRGIHLPMATKFAIGSFFGVLAIVVALIIDYQIHKVYQETGEAISIMWQLIAYFCLGTGEIFAIASAYEVAFTIAPKQQKGLASALNVFILLGVSNFIATALYNACSAFFTNDEGTTEINTLEKYTQAEVYLYWWVAFGISFLGVLLNLAPPVRKWVERVVDVARRNTVRSTHESSRKSFEMANGLEVLGGSKVLDSDSMLSSP